MNFYLGSSAPATTTTTPTPTNTTTGPTPAPGIQCTVKSERLFLGVLIEVYFIFPRIIFLIFNFSIFEKCHST